MTAVFYSEDARRLHIKQPRYKQGWCGAELQELIEYRRDFRTPICADCLDILDAKRAALRAQLDAARAGQGWRPVTEPPTEDGEYLVWCDSYEGCELQDYSTQLDRWYSNTGNPPDYWQPLPDKPDADAGEE